MWIRDRQRFTGMKKAFWVALLNAIAKGAAVAAKTGAKAVVGAGKLAVKGAKKGAAVAKKVAVDTVKSVGENIIDAKDIGSVVKDKGMKAGLKEVGKAMLKNSDLGKVMDMGSGIKDFVTDMSKNGLDTEKLSEAIKTMKDSKTEAGGGQGGSGGEFTPPTTPNAPVEKTKASFNSALIDSFVGKDPELGASDTREAAGRLAYFGDTLADVVRSNLKIDTAEEATRRRQIIEAGNATSGQVTSDMRFDKSLYNMASSEATKRLGGSFMNGLDKNLANKQKRLTEELYQNYLDKYGLSGYGNKTPAGMTDIDFESLSKEDSELANNVLGGF